MRDEGREEIILTYINENVSMQVLAKRFKVSKTTIVRTLDSKGLIPPLKEALEETKRKRWLEGKSTSGNQGHKILSKEQAQELATSMVEEGLTLRDLVEDDGPSLGTIFNAFTEENLGSELFSKVNKQYADNKSANKSSNSGINK